MKHLLRKLKSALGVEKVKNASSADFPLFDSYQEALDACNAEGYQTNDLVRVVVEKNEIYRSHLSSSRVLGLDSLRTMIGIGALQSQPTLRVLDFGGGGGYHHSITRTMFGPERHILWNVVETTAMAKAAKEELAGEGLRFFDDIREAAADLGHVDLVFTSGALQYTPEPLDFLKRLLDVRADHLFVTRTPLNDGSDRLISVQTSWLSSNGPGELPPGFTNCQIKYPVTFASRQKVVQMIEEFYKIRFSIDEDRFSAVKTGRVFNMCGYFCDLKK